MKEILIGIIGYALIRVAEAFIKDILVEIKPKKQIKINNP